VICNEDDTDGDRRRGAGSTCRLNRDQLLYVVKLAGRENFVGK